MGIILILPKIFFLVQFSTAWGSFICESWSTQIHFFFNLIKGARQCSNVNSVSSFLMFWKKTFHSYGVTVISSCLLHAEQMDVSMFVWTNMCPAKYIYSHEQNISPLPSLWQCHVVGFWWIDFGLFTISIMTWNQIFIMLACVRVMPMTWDYDCVYQIMMEH